MYTHAHDLRTALRCGRPGCACQKPGPEGPTHCPAHDDRNPSLSVTEHDGRVLVHCHAGCAQDAVLAALRARGLWPAGRAAAGGPAQRKRNADGELVPETARDPLGWLATHAGVPVDFLQTLPLRAEEGHVVFTFGPGLPEKLRRAGTKEFLWQPAGATPPPLWPLPPRVLPESVWLTEGETDAVVARHLGLEAFALTRGAGATLDRTQAEALRARGVRRVVLALDADQAGREGAETQARVLEQAGLEVLRVDWAAAGLDPLRGQKDLRDLWLQVRDPARVREALEGAVRTACVALRDNTFSVHEKQTAAREVRASDLQAEARTSPPLAYLPFLGESGFIIRGLSHLVSGYAKVGKTTLLAQVVAEWRGESVLWVTEEPRQVWLERLRRLNVNLGHVTLYFGLGATRQELLDRVRRGRESVAVVDTSKLLGIEDDCSASEVTEAVAPFLEACRAREATLVVAHHNRKGGGSHGEAIAGSHAFLALFDVALEILREEHHPHRRVVRGYSRVAEVPELAYERATDGHLVALGEPARLALQEVKERVAAVLGPEWVTLREVAALLTDPRPSDRQVREALAALVEEGVAEVEPGAGRRPSRWRRAEFVLLARKNPNPAMQHNGPGRVDGPDEDPPPGPPPSPHPEALDGPDPEHPPGSPPGPGDLDQALAEYRAHVEACGRCSWTGGPRCEEGHRLRRVYHARWVAALEAGTLDRGLGRVDGPAGGQPESALVDEDWWRYLDPDEFLPGEDLGSPDWLEDLVEVVA